MLNELDPQVKALLEQFQANAARHLAPATPLSAKEKIIALRQMVGFPSFTKASAVPSESVSRTEDFAIPGPAGKSPFVYMFLTRSSSVSPSSSLATVFE